MDAELADLRPAIRSFCYQLLGSPFDADDAVQDAMERAWKARATFDPARGSLLTWCLTIARHVCIDRIRATRRRPLPRDVRDAGIEVGAPLVPALDVPWLMPAPASWTARSGVEEQAERGEQVRFAVTALLQRLPVAQRAAFVLRELVGLSAVEAAAVVETSVAGLNSALQRARVAVRNVGDAPLGRPVDGERVERYAHAIERADVEALVRLVSADVVLEMPPVPAWSRGVPTYRAFMVDFFARRGDRFQTRLLRIGGDPALLLTQLTPDGPVPHTVQLFGAGPDGSIDQILVYFLPSLFALLATDESSPARS